MEGFFDLAVTHAFHEQCDAACEDGEADDDFEKSRGGSHDGLGTQNDARDRADHQEACSGEFGVPFEEVGNSPGDNKDRGDHDIRADDLSDGKLIDEDQGGDDEATTPDGSHSNDEADHCAYQCRQRKSSLRVGRAGALFALLSAAGRADVPEDRDAYCDEQNSEGEAEIAVCESPGSLVVMESAQEVSAEHGCRSGWEPHSECEFRLDVFQAKVLSRGHDLGRDDVKEVGSDGGYGIHPEEDYERRSHEGGPADAGKSYHESHEEAESYFCQRDE